MKPPISVLGPEYDRLKPGHVMAIPGNNVYVAYRTKSGQLRVTTAARLKTWTQFNDLLAEKGLVTKSDNRKPDSNKTDRTTRESIEFVEDLQDTTRKIARQKDPSPGVSAETFFKQAESSDDTETPSARSNRPIKHLKEPLMRMRSNPGMAFDPLADLINEQGDGIPDNLVPAYSIESENPYGAGAPDNESDIYSFGDENDPYALYQGPFGERNTPVNRRNPAPTFVGARDGVYTPSPAATEWRKQFGEIAKLAKKIQDADGCSRKEAFAQARAMLGGGGAARPNPARDSSYFRPAEDRTYPKFSQARGELYRAALKVQQATGCDLATAWAVAQGKPVTEQRAQRAGYKSGYAGVAKPNPALFNTGTAVLREMADSDPEAAAELERREAKRVAKKNGMFF